ncbi:MAG TPA: hypothetical protein PKW35_03220, partial [Nannocystaceae bacterium]|nr:hypothetical protein [Nannocystaceae bacterium]
MTHRYRPSLMLLALVVACSGDMTVTSESSATGTDTDGTSSTSTTTASTSSTTASTTATTTETSTTAETTAVTSSTSTSTSTTDTTTGGCVDPEVECGGACVDVSQSVEHCGGCDMPCDPGELCAGGLCMIECPGDQMACGDTCVDTQTDDAHCGGCDMPCDACSMCADGGCVMAPPPPAPDGLEGDTMICAGGTGKFMIPDVPGATGYTWEVPDGAVVSEGLGTTMVTVDFGDTPGQVCVTYSTECGVSEPTCVDVTFLDAMPGEQTFTFTGQAEMFEVPTCVSTLTIEAFGAQGNPGSPGGTSGLGGQATGTLAVTPGDMLKITVGGMNGFNGGGAAGGGGPNKAGNGGGASDVRTGAGDLA